MLPKFPLVIVKPTRQAEIETYAKKTQKAKRQMKSLAKENARLRKELEAHLSIDCVATKKTKTA